MFTDLRFRLRALFKRSQVEHELDEELRFHFDRHVEASMKAGLDRAEALRRARLEFGGLDQVKDEYRDALGVRLLDELSRDLRLAFRALRAAPMVSGVAVVSLALAIGATTAIFSLVNSLLLRALPVSDPARLVLVTDSDPSRLRTWSHPVWQEIQRTALFQRAAAWTFERLNLAEGGEADPVTGLWVTGSFFETLGVEPFVGRTIAIADDQRGGGPDGAVAVISHGFWQRRYGGAMDALGRPIRLNGVPFTIVGVTPPAFFGPEVGRAFDVVLPLETEPLIRGRDSSLDTPAANFLGIIGRLPAGQTADAVAGALRRAQPQIREATLGDLPRVATQAVVDRYMMSPFTLVPAATGASSLRFRYERPLLTLLAVVALLLLIACINIANLLLARASARRHQLSMQLALGASRWRLARQLLTESLVLSAAGAALGLLVALWGSEILVRQLSTPTVPVFLDVSIDGRLLAFTAGITVMTTLLFGVVPALRSSRLSPIEASREQNRAIVGSTRGATAGSLIVVQVAVSMILIVAAGLFVRSFVALSTRDLGFQPSQVLVVTIDAQPAALDPSQLVPSYERIRQAVLALPGVANAALSRVVPMTGGFTPPIEIPGVQREAMEGVEVFANLVSPGWFDTYGTPLRAGRDLNDRDLRGSARVVVVNESFARRFFGDTNPLGRTIVVYPGTPRELPPMEVVGVVADAVYTSPRSVPPTWYAPIDQFDIPQLWATARLNVRPASGRPEALTKSLAVAIARVHPGLSLTFQPLDRSIEAAMTRERLLAGLAGSFGALGLLLAGLGLYGVTAYAVSRRRAEIGLRMAMGARPVSVVALMLGRLSWLVATGVVVGAGASVWLSTFVGGLLYRLPPQDPATLASAALILCGVAAVAGWLPTRRAVRIDPAVVLREG